MDWAEVDERAAAPGSRLRLRVAPDPQVGKYVRGRIVAFARVQGIPESEVIDFLCAVGEALANAIEHARTIVPIEINVWMIGRDQLFCVVVDHGIGFTPEASAITEPPLPDEFAERGRGLPIMRTCSDMFAVRSVPGHGTTVMIGHRLRSREAGLQATG